VAPTLAQVHKTEAAKGIVEKKIEIKVGEAKNDTSSTSLTITGTDAELKNLADALKADGLVSDPNNTSIEIKDGKIIINGAVQTDEVFKKY
ncbi:hypothetical protein, partial [Streptomyces brasiliscabiei]|uniref:hypothetical protein n=1 Tax=Streptomyces brasiliscabiei TaxID=2736302 RepID=UPI00301492CE